MGEHLSGEDGIITAAPHAVFGESVNHIPDGSTLTVPHCFDVAWFYHQCMRHACWYVHNRTGYGRRTHSGFGSLQIVSAMMRVNV